jgi:hypothetical protein
MERGVATMRYCYGNYQYSDEQIEAFLNYKKFKEYSSDDYSEFKSDCVKIFFMALSFLLPMMR